MPLTYYIVFSSCVSPKFLLFNKTKVTRLFFFPTVDREEKKSEKERQKASTRAENSSDRERNSCYRTITVLGTSADGNAPLGNFSKDEERIFGRYFGGTGQFPRYSYAEKYASAQ